MTDPLLDMYSELGSHFEEKLLTVATCFVHSDEDLLPDSSYNTHIDLLEEVGLSIPYLTSSAYSVLVNLDPSEKYRWRDQYSANTHFSEVWNSLRNEKDWTNPKYPQYYSNEDGLLYYEDVDGNSRLCVPKNLQVKLIGDIHNSISEAAHSGYHKTYNRITSMYYWPHMSRDIKRYTTICDICQKSKHQRQPAAGLLQPIPIPT
jgi:Integrase zinc binding domain